MTSVAVFCFYVMKYERPAYLINPVICRQNIRDMAEKAAHSGLVFRPHFKTHQSLAIGSWFRDAGIEKITVSSLSAADYFAGDGWNDITVAFPVNIREMDLINRLASKIRLGLLVEHPEVAALLERKLENPVDVFIKIDTGYHRTGLAPEDMPVIRELAGVIRSSTVMTLKGLLTHAGHTYHAVTKEEIRQIYLSSVGILRAVRDELVDIQPGLILSYGDTPSCTIMESFPGIDEIRPGNFIFYDLMQLAAGVCSFSQVAGILVCPVVAVHPSRNQAVLYGGAIHFSKESVVAGSRRIFGQMVEMDGDGWLRPVDGAFLVSLSQEHGILEAPAGIIRDLRPGSLVGVIPVHSCLAASLIRGYRLPDGTTADYFPGI